MDSPNCQSHIIYAGRVGDAARHPFGCRVPAIDLLEMLFLQCIPPVISIFHRDNDDEVTMDLGIRYSQTNPLYICGRVSRILQVLERLLEHCPREQTEPIAREATRL